MSYRLSILDKSLIPDGADAADALRNTLALAIRAEQLNYHRYWCWPSFTAPPSWPVRRRRYWLRTCWSGRSGFGSAPGA
jgi:alkanesulfonate monooxygenase SsuD/methylene tetrahydromethanopterin reductase-like flavin-dependent oxidoreductase (luciferase family)